MCPAGARPRPRSGRCWRRWPTPPLTVRRLVYEPKYDGIRGARRGPAGTTARASADLVPARQREDDPVPVDRPSALTRRRPSCALPLLLDGEIVALDEQGRPAASSGCRGASISRARRRRARRSCTAGGAHPVRSAPRRRRRPARPAARPSAGPASRRTSAQLTSETIRLSEQVVGDGRALQARAKAEGLGRPDRKDAQSTYQSGRRSPAWRKLKILHEQEFVVGGWTEPRQTRQHFGALLLGRVRR